MTGALVVQGDLWLLKLTVGNLLQNALDFAPKGSAISVRGFCFASKVMIEIEDSGPCILDDASARVFERFYSLPRPDSGKKSTGLGLCFVKEVAQLHGGGVELANREGVAGREGDADSQGAAEPFLTEYGMHAILRS
ncbi:MAG: two-component system sensor histidine kinase CreC [Prosthecobacter sp.]|nr:two-component system sensor histidine kinase CreC [Prosthecobacter sp.]